MSAEAHANLVPGVMRCAKCNFRLNRINLNVRVGTVTAGDSKTEPCPNGCGPLWPVTWEQEAREGYEIGESLLQRAVAAEVALASKVFADVSAERRRQDEQWGGPAHDDQHDPRDFDGYINHQMTKAVHEGYPRERFVKIAALAVAAIESIDRKAAAAQEAQKP